jgi:hypothetical protein
MLVPRWVIAATVAIFALIVIAMLAGRYHLASVGAYMYRIDRLTGKVWVCVPFTLDAAGQRVAGNCKALREERGS